MANIAIPRIAVTYCALLSCVSLASTGLSKHGWALNCCCAWTFGTAAVLAQGGGGMCVCVCVVCVCGVCVAPQ